MVGVELVILGVHFENCDSLHAPVSSLLISLGIDVELVQEVLDIILVLGGQSSSLEVLSEGQIRVAVSLAWWLSAYSAT